MQSTILLGGLFFSVLTVDFVLWALFLALGLRWAKVERVTRRRIVIATMTVFLISVAVNVVFIAAHDSPDDRSIASMVMQLGLLVVVKLAVIRKVFHSTVWQAFRAYLPTLIPSTLIGITVGFLVIPHVVEAFVITSSAMAPTLLGPHLQSDCSQCGEPCYGSPDINDSRMYAPGERTMICDNFHTRPVDEVDATVHAADRTLTVKYLSPRRWDLAVFRPPFAPEALFVMRVVGLPGETIVLSDGQVFADGSALQLPPELNGISFTATPPGHELLSDPIWGTVENPATLEANEYFVLGDNTTRSRDSRHWPTNDTGHPPYALPAENIEGVVTHIYWPPTRWRIIR